jgi:hypothetical protein
MNKRTISNDFLKLDYRTDSLRIVGLTPKGKKNLLADLSHLPAIPTPHGDFYFHGGHRLWHAPEAMPRTYAPDTGDIIITQFDDGLRLEAPTEPASGIGKQIDIRLAPASPKVTLTHTLINNGAWPVELAPWAITQFRLGGIVILPLPTEKIDESGLLPNRQFSFWTYSNLSDPRLTLQNEYSYFNATPGPAFKMGYFNSAGWLAYWIEGTLFKKTFAADAHTQYPDNNCNTEIYCNDGFVELESLGGLIRLSPGETVEHGETWELANTLPPDVAPPI